MGINSVGSDDLQDNSAHTHWLLGPLDLLAAHINPEVEYLWIDPDFPADGLTSNTFANTWIVVVANDSAEARRCLKKLTNGQSQHCATLLVICGPAGVWVSRFLTPTLALSALAACSINPPIAQGPMELAILAAGLILGEIMLGTGNPLQASAPSHLVACYDLWHPRRTHQQASAMASQALLAKIATPMDPQAVFHDKRLVMVGAGALGNWTVLPIAMENPKRIQIYDGDDVELHNLNRQLLLMGGVGSNKAEYMCRLLSALTHRDAYEAVPSYVEANEDFKDLSCDVLVSVPDNDRTRLLCGTVALEHACVLATAGSSAMGGQAIVADPTRACLHCIMGNEVSASTPGRSAHSCGRVANDAVVSSNMVAAGLLVSELRAALAGRSWSNMRYEGGGTPPNRLRRMITRVPCHHVNRHSRR